MRPVIAPTCALALLVLAACAAQPSDEPAATAAAPQAPLYVRHTMQAEVNPAIVGIWDVTNNIFTDAGEQDASLITGAQWDSLAANAAKLAESGERMASATDINAASAGNVATDEYEVPMAHVQRFISGDPQGFRDMSASFAVLARNLEAAAMARDGATTLELVGQMDGECAACHAQFWYAEAQ